MSNVKSNKNSLIELMRFLFALWVLYYHSFVPFKSSIFSDGFLAVEFFFVLSGFYLVRSIDKYDDKPIKSGLFGFLKHRFAAIAVPFLINEVFVLYYSFVVEFSYNFLFGYLWYIRDLFIAMALIFLFRRLIKSDKVFYITTSALSLLALFGFGWISLMAWPGGPFRSIASMPIGMLAALIPKIKCESEGKSKILPKVIIALGLFVSALACLAIAFSPEKPLAIKYLLVIIVYPAMLYFASCVHFSNGFLNWLGSLSFPIYAFQCVLRVVEYHFTDDNTYLFVILMIIVLAFSASMEIIERKKQKALQKN